MTFTHRAARVAGVAALAAALSAATLSGAAATHLGAVPFTESAATATANDGWESEGLSLDAEENQAVNAFLAQAQEAERRISPQVERVALLTDAELIGFDHRLKTEGSLKRKVATWLDETPNQSVEDVLADINDSVRYTLQWPEGEYAEGVETAATVLSAWRNESVRWSNTWANETGYKAVNSAWRDSGTQHVYEVQFHTPASHQAATETHPLYEEQRLPGTSPERVAELREEQRHIFAAVPVPAGALELTAPVARGQLVPAG